MSNQSVYFVPEEFIEIIVGQGLAKLNQTKESLIFLKDAIVPVSEPTKNSKVQFVKFLKDQELLIEQKIKPETAKEEVLDAANLAKQNKITKPSWF